MACNLLAMEIHELGSYISLENALTGLELPSTRLAERGEGKTIRAGERLGFKFWCQSACQGSLIMITISYSPRDTAVE